MNPSEETRQEASAPAEDRAAFVRENAAALVTYLEAKVERQRLELAKLNQRCSALTPQRDRLRRDLAAENERSEKLRLELLRIEAERDKANDAVTALESDRAVAWQTVKGVEAEREALKATLNGMAVGGEVSLQRLSDCGINPFAVSMLVESLERHPNPVPVSFVVRGVRMVLIPPEKKAGAS